MALPIAPENVQALKGFETRIASNRSLLTDLDTVNAALGGPITDHHRQLMNRAIYSARCLHQVEDQVKKYPQTKEKMYAYYGLPVVETARGLGLRTRTLEKKANEFGKFRSWPAPSTATEIRVCAQFYDGEKVHIEVTTVPNNDRFKRVRAALLDAFKNHNPAEERVSMFMETNGVRHGPIRNQHDWILVVNHPDNVHRVSLYLTNQV